MNAIHSLANPRLPDPSSAPPRRILVAEDDSSLRKLNTIVLALSGYAVDAVEDGAAAWEAMNAESYDLLITDNNMPRWTGVDLLKKLRASRMEMPVVMATGAFPPEDFVRQPWLRPNAMLLKPYSTEQLLETVKGVLHMTAEGHEQTVPAKEACRMSRRPTAGSYDEAG